MYILLQSPTVRITIYMYILLQSPTVRITIYMYILFQSPTVRIVHRHGIPWHAGRKRRLAKQLSYLVLIISTSSIPQVRTLLSLYHLRTHAFYRVVQPTEMIYMYKTWRFFFLSSDIKYRH